MPNTVAYIPSSLGTKLAEKTVMGIYVTAHPPESATASRPGHQTTASSKTNHWVLYLITSTTTFIRFDISPTGTGPGILIIRELPYALSKSEVKTFTLSVNQRTTVKTVLNVIKERHYDRYNFATSGQGCRYWVSCVLRLLEEKNILTSGIDDAIAGLKSVWTKRGILVPNASQTGIVQGQFY